mmetsp:Transcript_13337/g.22403  ORF Transcript_13337/g.22403 Transcript_13337/m.22403 type:complete len:142 (-) Transcript_13337:229-654(-)
MGAPEGQWTPPTPPLPMGAPEGQRMPPTPPLPMGAPGVSPLVHHAAASHHQQQRAPQIPPPTPQPQPRRPNQQPSIGGGAEPVPKSQPNMAVPMRLAVESPLTGAGGVADTYYSGDNPTMIRDLASTFEQDTAGTKEWERL